MYKDLDALTEKERETLRLIVRGHDAKSMAAHLDLSVHTINERLRSARRKLSVTSSREAARILDEYERQPPKKIADKELGEAKQQANTDPLSPSARRHSDDQRKPRNFAPWLGGILTMSFLAAILVFSAVSSGDETPLPQSENAEMIAKADAQRENAARDWLALVDASNWAASFDATGRTFQQLNTLEGWQSASLQARAPLGTVISREAVGFQSVNTPPSGHILVRFRTDFSERSGAIETVTLEREKGALKVVGYTID